MCAYSFFSVTLDPGLFRIPNPGEGKTSHTSRLISIIVAPSGSMI